MLSPNADAASVRGMLLGMAGYSLFAVHDAVVKAVIIDLPVPQILALRCLTIVAACLVIGRTGLVRGLAASPNKALILLRAVLMLSAWVMYYSSARELKLAEMTTLYYVAPVVTTILAVLFLKERLTLARVGAAAIGFFGVVVACNPAGISLGLPVVMVLAAAVCWSIGMILMRRISRTESALVQVLALNVVFVVVTLPFAIAGWQPMDARTFVFVIASGALAGTAQLALVEAARMVPASVLGTVEYSALIWAFVFGYVFWREEPAGFVYIGALLIVAAGIVLAWSERRRRAAAPVSPT